MDFEVNRADIHESRVVDEDPSDVAPGQALLRVDRFALTTNNITYAVMGDALKYWDFFPSADPDVWGRIPVWGFADVIDSADDDLASGTRVYGYLPTATHLVVTPGRVDPRGFVDAAPHRASLPGAYNGYRRVDTDASEDPAYEYHRMVLWPLFFTSFLIDDFLNDNAFFRSLDCFAAVSAPVFAWNPVGRTCWIRDLSSSGVTPAWADTSIASNFPPPFSTVCAVTGSNATSVAPARLSAVPNLAMPTIVACIDGPWSSTVTWSPRWRSLASAVCRSTTISPDVRGGCPPGSRRSGLTSSRRWHSGCSLSFSGR